MPLYSCSANLNTIITDNDYIEENDPKSKNIKTQINIDELLMQKEPIDLISIKVINKIGILLPMTGKFSKIGKAILEGIENEIANNMSINKPELFIYDTGADFSIKDTYSEIISENIDFIIGPLQKKQITKILNYGKKSIPILTLNYSSDLDRSYKYLYQFGLLPEDEAICIAEKAIIDGNNNASLLFPKNKWGQRISNSFSERYIELGGNIVDEISYEEGSEQINNLVLSLLKIKESIKRKNDIQSILNIKLQYKPYIANDLNTIFSVGNSEDMRRIKPQFNFNFAESIPFYSTSHIYNGVLDKKTNEDLNDIKFCDIPWLYNDKDKELKRNLVDNVSKRSLLRFIALGMDSIKILYNIDNLKTQPDRYLLGNSGYLQLNKYNKIRRDPIIAQFKNGVAREIPF